MMPSENHGVTILLAGDTAPVNSNASVFASEECRWLSPELQSQIRQCDAFVLNLESPLTDNDASIQKSGWVLRAPTGTVNGFVTAGTTAVNLANNHIMDQGSAGLETTIRHLEAAGVGWFGAGRTPADASKPFIIAVNGQRIALMGLTTGDSRPNISDAPGPMLMTPEISLPRVQQACSENDHVIVLLHAGLERYPYPSPRLQRYCRFLVGQGVSAVICQHSHCIGAQEYYGEGYILYGQGNFLFDWGVPSDKHWEYGLLSSVRLVSGRRPEISHTVTEQTFPGVKPAAAMVQSDILNEFDIRSSDIRDRKQVEKLWKAHVRDVALDYMYPLSGRTGIIRKVVRRLGIANWMVGRWRMSWLRSMLRNADLREILEGVLEEEDTR